MAIFSEKVSQEDFDSYRNEVRGHFDALRSDVKSRLDQLQTEIGLKASDSESVARQAAENAVLSEQQVKNSEAAVRASLTALEEIKAAAQAELNLITQAEAAMQEQRTSLSAALSESQVLQAQLIQAKKDTDGAVSAVAINLDKSKTILAESNTLPANVASSQKTLEELRGMADDLKNLLSHAGQRKTEIDDLHKEILGYDVKTDGKNNHIDGLRDSLQKSFDTLSGQASGLAEAVQDAVDETKGQFAKKFTDQQAEFDQLVQESTANFEAVKNQLTGLLPGAMAEGLSAAYDDKRKDEEKILGKAELFFNIGIGLLVAVSLIPFGVDVYLLGWKSHDLVKVIQETPSLIFGILPLYLPVLWFASSANKKVKLSKRLIEEYTHKAVLGKTFSGLANQIDNLPQSQDIKGELRTRLLYNILQVSAENPGKLILDYNNSDHPLMDLLQSSARLSDAADSFSKIPGLEKVLRMLAARKDKLLEAEAVKVKDGVNIQTAFDGSGGEDDKATPKA